jgi:hypothetical protein
MSEVKQETAAEMLIRLGMDGTEWAKEFMQIYPQLDYGTVFGWFANAIMAGYDHANYKNKAVIEGKDKEISELNGFIGGLKIGAEALRKEVAELEAKLSAEHKNLGLEINSVIMWQKECDTLKVRIAELESIIAGNNHLIKDLTIHRDQLKLDLEKAVEALKIIASGDENIARDYLAKGKK